PTVFAELAGRGTVAVDVQGMLRRRRQGKVTWNMTREIRHMMRFVDVLKADADEAKFLTGCNSTRDALTELGNWGPREILITTGSHGSYIFDSGKIWSIPALKPEIVLDPTGCGDTYLSGYIAARSRGFEAQRSAYIGAAAASYKLEYSGPLQESFNELCKRIDTDSSVITSVGASPNSSGN
ncbi:uncharacterized protein METZ01_LOCUS481790, partial [marine metagenome]